MTKKNYIDECLERAAAATEGPWNYTYDGSSDYSIGPGDPQVDTPIGLYSRRENASANMDFIAHARQDVPELCRRLNKVLEFLWELNIRGAGPEEILRAGKLARELEAPLSKGELV